MMPRVRLKILSVFAWRTKGTHREDPTFTLFLKEEAGIGSKPKPTKKKRYF